MSSHQDFSFQERAAVNTRSAAALIFITSKTPYSGPITELEIDRTAAVLKQFDPIITTIILDALSPMIVESQYGLEA